jgi:hypothetical protein
MGNIDTRMRRKNEGEIYLFKARIGEYVLIHASLTQ